MTDNHYNGLLRATPTLPAHYYHDPGHYERELETIWAKPFPDLSVEERRTAYHYVVNRPSIFIAAHVDYVRSVRLLPLGPELTELQVEWLYLAETPTDKNPDIQRAVDFTQLIMEQDAAVAELNQQGLHSLRHEHGVLMPEEYDVHEFQNWVREQLSG